MKLLAVSPENDSIRERFFTAAFGQHTGYVAFASKSKDGRFSEEYFKYPDQLEEMLRWVNDHFLDYNLYYCSQLLRKPKRLASNVILCPNLWADLDEANPEDMDPRPTIAVQSSPGRWQGLWRLSEAAEPNIAERANRRLTYKIEADPSGWDLTQLLRIPLTYNFKRNDPELVTLLWLSDNTIDISVPMAFEDPPGDEHLDIPFPEDEIGQLDANDIIIKYKFKLPHAFTNTFTNNAKQDRSSVLWAIESMCIESGMSLAEAFTVAEASAANKYAEDGRPRYDLWKEICKAQANIMARLKVEPAAKIEGLLSEDEKLRLKTLPPTFIEKYQEWATERTDAAPGYHDAGAFIVLSALLSESLELNMSFGSVRPVLWFMILGDTTLTRKTTAMEMALDLLNLVYPESLLATDGSVEGIMMGLSQRSGRTSLFVRDEVSGLLDSMRHKDYLAGLVEGFSRWYEGKTDIRMLKKERIEVRNPRFIMFCGGIKTRILEIMDREYVINGFIPRFLFITADADLDSYRPPTMMSTQLQTVSSELAAFLSNLKNVYGQDMTMNLGGQQISTPQTFDVKMSKEALNRYADFERAMNIAGAEADESQLFSPTFDRMAKSGLKISMIFAAIRQTPTEEGHITIELDDMLRAIYYIDKWKKFTIEVVENAGKGVSERQLSRAFELIKGGKDSRSSLMRAMHLVSREADWIILTLEERGLIVTSKQGKLQRLLPAAL